MVSSAVKTKSRGGVISPRQLTGVAVTVPSSPSKTTPARDYITTGKEADESVDDWEVYSNYAWKLVMYKECLLEYYSSRNGTRNADATGSVGYSITRETHRSGFSENAFVCSACIHMILYWKGAVEQNKNNPCPHVPSILHLP